jgi:hypothetical protein
MPLYVVSVVVVIGTIADFESLGYCLVRECENIYIPSSMPTEHKACNNLTSLRAYEL